MNDGEWRAYLTSLYIQADDKYRKATANKPLSQIDGLDAMYELGIKHTIAKIARMKDIWLNY